MSNPGDYCAFLRSFVPKTMLFTLGFDVKNGIFGMYDVGHKRVKRVDDIQIIIKEVQGCPHLTSW